MVDQALHNIRSNPSASDPSIAKIASGQMYIASEVVKKEDEEWIRLHPQTLHTYRLPDKPCWIAVYIKNETHFLKGWRACKRSAVCSKSARFSPSYLRSTEPQNSVGSMQNDNDYKVGVSIPAR